MSSSIDTNAMQSLFTVYLAVSIFGVGVTLIDFLGLLDHSGAADDAVDEGDPCALSETDTSTSDSTALEGGQLDHAGSMIAPIHRGQSVIMRIVGVMRTAVYFSLGAGPTGLFATLTGQPPLSGLAWAGAAGFSVALLGRFLKKLFRKDLDSTIKPRELLMEKARIIIPVGPGAIGKAVVTRYGHETEIYVKCRDRSAALPKGTQVLISDFDESEYWVDKG
ncbi:hypothetical protein ACYULU_16275 [Breznakiellaceae bacterium SP9]